LQRIAPELQHLVFGVSIKKHPVVSVWAYLLPRFLEWFR
jgi:hypothetical protein